MLLVNIETLPSTNLRKQTYERAEKIVEDFKKNLKNDPGNLQAVYGLATCLIAKGSYDEARGFVDRLDSEMPANEDVKELKMRLPVADADDDEELDFGKL